MLIVLPMQLPAITESVLQDVTLPSPRGTWDSPPPPHTHLPSTDPDRRSGSNIAVSSLHLYSTFLHSGSRWGALQLHHIHPVVQTLVDTAAGKAGPLGPIMARCPATRTLWIQTCPNVHMSDCRSLAELLYWLNRPQGPSNLYSARHPCPSLSWNVLDEECRARRTGEVLKPIVRRSSGFWKFVATCQKMIGTQWWIFSGFILCDYANGKRK